MDDKRRKKILSGLSGCGLTATSTPNEICFVAVSHLKLFEVEGALLRKLTYDRKTIAIIQVIAGCLALLGADGSWRIIPSRRGKCADPVFGLPSTMVENPGEFSWVTVLRIGEAFLAAATAPETIASVESIEPTSRLDVDYSEESFLSPDEDSPLIAVVASSRDLEDEGGNPDTLDPLLLIDEKPDITLGASVRKRQNGSVVDILDPNMSPYASLAYGNSKDKSFLTKVACNLDPGIFSDRRALDSEVMLRVYPSILGEVAWFQRSHAITCLLDKLNGKWDEHSHPNSRIHENTIFMIHRARIKLSAFLRHMSVAEAHLDKYYPN
jgi:hypothetical protein